MSFSSITRSLKSFLSICFSFCLTTRLMSASPVPNLSWYWFKIVVCFDILLVFAFISCRNALFSAIVEASAFSNTFILFISSSFSSILHVAPVLLKLYMSSLKLDIIIHVNVLDVHRNVHRNVDK